MKFRYPELEIHKRNNETLHRTLRKMVGREKNNS
jgi:hypothetical protein